MRGTYVHPAFPGEPAKFAGQLQCRAVRQLSVRLLPDSPGRWLPGEVLGGLPFGPGVGGLLGGTETGAPGRMQERRFGGSPPIID